MSVNFDQLIKICKTQYINKKKLQGGGGLILKKLVKKLFSLR